MPVNINIDKAKEITHASRRTARNKAFKPLDIEATIPHLAVEAEAKRAVIRAEDAELQVDIDNATTVDELKELNNVN
jgi:hypothetical protein